MEGALDFICKNLFSANLGQSKSQQKNEEKVQSLIECEKVEMSIVKQRESREFT